MKRAIVLGSGNAFNDDGRAHAAVWLESGGGSCLLLDCGPTTLQRLKAARLPTDAIDAVVLTHFHGDHLLGLPFVLLQMIHVDRRSRPLEILGPEGGGALIREAMTLAYRETEIGFEIDYRPVTPGTFSCRDCRVEAIRMDHRPESLGYRVTGPRGRTVAFSGDACFDDALERLVDGADLALVELTLFARPDPAAVRHVALEEVVRGRDRLRPRRLVFTHLDDRVAAAARAAGVGETAEDGSIFEL